MIVQGRLRRIHIVRLLVTKFWSSVTDLYGNEYSDGQLIYTAVKLIFFRRIVDLKFAGKGMPSENYDGSTEKLKYQ